jgi:PAS domain S-box-containing protein
MKYHVTPINHELVMNDDEFIVSKTNTKGIITYANRTFIKFAGYTEEELIGKQQNIIRHPDMPRAVFKLLWSTIQNGKEMFAYVKNMSKDGSYYWVFANVSPVYDINGTLIGYYSVRRKPKSESISFISDLYRKMLDEEKRVGTKDGMDASTEILNNLLLEKKMSYEEFVLSI